MRSAEAEKASFDFQARRFTRGLVPEQERIDALVERIVQEYPTSQPLEWNDDSVLMRVIDDVMNNAVNRTSSPGVPLSALARTNAKLFLEHGALVLNCVKERLQLLATTDPNYVRDLTAEELVQQGFCDPIRVFVKNEPHNREKISQGRLRLICSISIVDQIVERILHVAQNEKEIEVWDQIPSKPGGSMNNDEDVKKFASEVFMHDNLVDIDISGFDWSVQEWELAFDMRCRIELAENPSEQWVNASYNRVLCLGLGVFSFSDGVLVAQRERGIQKSGSYLTASGNSRIKVGLGYLIGANFVVAYGDDAIEDRIEGAPEKYAELGHRVKEYNPCNGDCVTFCSSTIYKDGTWRPETWSKTLFRFLCQRDISYELWLQFQYTLRHCPHIGRIREFIIAEGGVLGDKINGWEEEEESASANWPES